MGNNKILIFITIVFVIFSFSSTIFLVYKTSKIISPYFTGKASGQVKFCYNNQPIISINCTNLTYGDMEYFCKINVTDPDGILVFNLSFVQGNKIFNITNSGIINFTGDNRQVGNYSINITVTDGYNCENSFDSGFLNLTILCNNTQPVINLSNCSNIIYQNQNFSCKVNVTDVDVRGNFTFNSRFMLLQKTFSTSNEAIFNITSLGIINFAPNNSQVGYYEINITVDDNRYCSNSNNSAKYNFTVVNINDAPVFSGPIANQSWEQDAALVTFDLDNYFNDPDRNQLRYTHSILNNIDVRIDEENKITFTPITGWSGSEYITFFAWDPYKANASSNDILLMVAPKQKPQTTAPGGGGGGAGGITKCIPEWYCSEWEQCLKESYQVRQCTDLHKCGTLLSKPNTTQACNYIASCYNGIQDGDETGIDCGGLCPPCPTCNDRIQNQGELDIDCGGPCKPCPGCNNGIKDGFEAGIDCGGPYCKSCPTCFDTIKNQGETGVDCGGPCGPCKEIEVPTYLKERNRLITTLLISLILLIAILLITYRFSHEFIKKLFARISWHLAAKEKRRKEEVLLEISATKTILDELNKLEKRLSKENVQELSIAFSKIVREYFKDLLKLSYEFTYEELIKEIKARKIDSELEKILITFFTKSIQMEYAKYKLTKTELQTLINEAREIVHITSIEDKETKEPKLLEINPKLSETEKLLVTISNSQKLLQNNEIEKAMKLYMVLLDNYNKLPEKEKDIIYPHLSRLYNEIKLASKRR